MTATSVSGTGRAGFNKRRVDRKIDRKYKFIISGVCSPQSTATPTGSPASLCTPPCLISSPLPLMVLRVSGTIQGAHYDLPGFVLIRSFLSLAHRTSSTTSPLTAVDTLFGALDVATEEVEMIKTQVAGCPPMKIHLGMGGVSRINILCSFPPLSSAFVCC